MKNELLFFLQNILVAGVVWTGCLLGKEALVACISFLFVLANMFVVKQMTLFGFDVTASDVYIVGAVLGFNLLQEFFGKGIAKKTIWISFFVSFVFVAMSRIHLSYAPNIYDSSQTMFTQLLQFLPRIVIASLVANIVSQYFRLFLYDFLQRVFINKYFFARNILVTTSEQFLDTLVFGFIGLYGVVHTLTDVFIVSFSIKLITILCSTPWLLLSRWFFRKRFSSIEVKK